MVEKKYFELPGHAGGPTAAGIARLIKAMTHVELVALNDAIEHQRAATFNPETEEFEQKRSSKPVTPTMLIDAAQFLEDTE